MCGHKLDRTRRRKMFELEIAETHPIIPGAVSLPFHGGIRDSNSDRTQFYSSQALCKFTSFTQFIVFMNPSQLAMKTEIIVGIFLSCSSHVSMKV